MKLRALLVVAALLVPAPVRAATPAIFRVGVAVADITPTAPQYLGGYGRMDHPTATIEDPLQVRAFFVGSGRNAAEFAIVDSQGWFAGYQEGPYGVTDARAQAAAQIYERGYYVSQANIIVSSTHSHAAPTIMGIWGPTDPSYLKTVHDQTVKALVEAATSTRAAELWTGAGEIATIIAHAVTATDHYDGWSIDDELPFLWAREPGTGATIGLYDNVPVHADSYKGAACGRISADTPGVVRSLLDSLLGGTTVSAMGTLGRQETIGPSACGPPGVAEITRDGRFIANRLMAGLARAKPITDSTVAGAEQYVLTPGTNAALLALVYANTQGFQCFDDPIGACTIDRSIEPPYLVGNTIGTYVTSLRIGDNVWVSEPGEAFPEVSAAIRQSVIGAGAVHVVGMAQDQLGYYYPPEDYPSTQMSPSDFFIYNVGPDLADANVRASAVNATLLGFVGVPFHPIIGDEQPLKYFAPGIQFFPIPLESASTTVSITGYANKSGAAWLFGQLDPVPNPYPTTVSPPAYDFGDGTTASNMPEEFDHVFPGPGSYRISAVTTAGSSYDTAGFSQTIVIDEPPVASVSTDGCALMASVEKGDGHILAAHWRFSDGSTADGIRVVAPAGTSATVAAVDGVGDSATTTLPVVCQ